jgi:hypothetical protein
MFVPSYIYHFTKYTIHIKLFYSLMVTSTSAMLSLNVFMSPSSIPGMNV